MIKVSEAYKQASSSTERKSYIIARYGLYDKNAKNSISDINSTLQPFSDEEKTIDEERTSNYNYISCEPNRVILNDGFYFIQNKNKKQELQDIAYWSNELSNENKLFATNPKIIYLFSNDIEFTELTLHFQEVCESFIVRYYYNNNLVAIRNITNNTSTQITTNGSSVLSNVVFDKLEIEFVKTTVPYRFIKFNEIDFGVYQKFNNSQILDLDIIDELSIDSSELSSNSLTLVIDDENGEYDVLNPNNKLRYLQERQEITIFHYLKVGEKYHELPLGTFLLKEFKAKNQKLELQAYDDVYFMNQLYYGSKYYENEEITKVLEDLFNYFNYTNYIIDKELQGIKISGYIPRVEFREALRLIAESGKCVVAKTRNGETYIFKTYDPVSKTFERKIIFGENPVKNLYNNVIDILEYNYSNVQENFEIYNSTMSVGQYVILFENYPIKQDTIEKIEENNNYEILVKYATGCVINVIAETTIKLKGTYIKEMSAVQRIKKSNEQKLSTDYAITKVDNHLITRDNLQEIANWKLSRGAIKYNFETLTIPYLEVGDTCEYQTKYNSKNTFIPTRIEFSKSILQSIEGE